MQYSSNIIYASYMLARDYWSHNKRAWVILAAIIGCQLAYIYATILANSWYSDFYNALQQYHKALFVPLLWRFIAIAAANVLFQLVSYYLRKYLDISWRRWETKRYLSNWLAERAYYKSCFVVAGDNPDQRISEDIWAFITLTLDLSLGSLSAVVTLCSFIGILWQLSGEQTIYGFNVHGSLVWLSLLYAVVGTYLIVKIAKKLAKLNFQQQQVEANFRFDLFQVREYAEEIAFYGAENQQQARLMADFVHITNNFMRLIHANLRITGFNFIYSQIAVIFPLIISIPRYLAKHIALGALMQINSAFGRVQDSFSYFMDVYPSIANLRAVIERLTGFNNTLKATQALPFLASLQQDTSRKTTDRHGVPHLASHSTSLISAKNITLMLPDNTILLQNISFSLGSGDRLLISGKSGSGKTTLLRALAGLWPFATGEIWQVAATRAIFLTQQSYIAPQQSLRQIICAHASTIIADTYIQQVLAAVGLTAFYSQIDEIANWGTILSVGEQHKLSAISAVLAKPDILYVDELTAALDEEAEEAIYSLLCASIPGVIISIGHRSSITKWHNKYLSTSTFCVNASSQA